MSLLRQAYLRGYLKPGEARLLDRKWWRKLGWVLSAVEQEDLVRYHSAEHALHCGAMDYSAGGTCFTTHWEQALEVQSKLRKLLFPWMPKEDRSASISRLAKEWEKQFGNLADPETTKKLRHTIEMMHRTAREGRENKRSGLVGKTLLGAR